MAATGALIDIANRSRSPSERIQLVIPPTLRTGAEPAFRYLTGETVRALGRYYELAEDRMHAIARKYFLAIWCVESPFDSNRELTEEWHLASLLARLDTFPGGSEADLLTEWRYATSLNGPRDEYWAAPGPKPTGDPVRRAFAIAPFGSHRFGPARRTMDAHAALRIIGMNDALGRPEHRLLIERFVQAGGHRPPTFGR